MLKKTLYLVTAAAALFVSTFAWAETQSPIKVASAAVSGTSSAGSSAQAADYLFIQTARSATIRETAKPGVYKMILHGVSPYLTYFTDRPQRSTGLISVPSFLQNWKQGKDSFSKNAPNVGVSGVSLHGICGETGTNDSKANKDTQYVVTLVDPKYNGDTGTLVYTVKTLPGVGIAKECELNNIALFIDGGVCFSCGGGGF